MPNFAASKLGKLSPLLYHLASAILFSTYTCYHWYLQVSTFSLLSNSPSSPSTIRPVTWKIEQRPAPFSNRRATHLLHSGSLPCQDMGKPNNDRPRMRETLFNMLPLATPSVRPFSVISSCLHATGTYTNALGVITFPMDHHTLSIKSPSILLNQSQSPFLSSQLLLAPVQSTCTKQITILSRTHHGDCQYHERGFGHHIPCLCCTG